MRTGNWTEVSQALLWREIVLIRELKSLLSNRKSFGRRHITRRLYVSGRLILYGDLKEISEGVKGLQELELVGFEFFPFLDMRFVGSAGLVGTTFPF